MTAIKALVGRAKDRSAEAERYAKQAKRLGFEDADKKSDQSIAVEAVEARFITAQDPVIETADGERLPAVPVTEALRLNHLKDQITDSSSSRALPEAQLREAKDGTVHGAPIDILSTSDQYDAPLRNAVPPPKTNPLFPPLPLYGPPSFLRGVQCWFFRCSSSILSLCFLLVIVVGAFFRWLTLGLERILKIEAGAESRPFRRLEIARAEKRSAEEQAWRERKRRKSRDESDTGDDENAEDNRETYTPLEGGPDPLVCDVRYYARRVGLEVEEFKVQTEDGFVVELWHIYNPKEYTPLPQAQRDAKPAKGFQDQPSDPDTSHQGDAQGDINGGKRYPVLLIPGLLQSGGAYCCTDDDSLAFYLAKSGYDVWIGNNRCGFNPEHRLLGYGDPRMWAWNIRQMGVMDLSAFVSRILEETAFEKLALVCHSQGTAQTMVALAKEQRPDIGEKLSVFCALAPAAYAGPLIRKIYFKFMQLITPGMFRLIFGIHAFMPFMMSMHAMLPGKVYGAIGYRVFAFLFDWSDERWDLGLRDRMFQFSPVYVSSESMRWWLGRECFAKQKCILSTRDEWRLEDEEDEEEDIVGEIAAGDPVEHVKRECRCNGHYHEDHGRYSWYDERAPPFAFWVAGRDRLVDGKRLLRRFERGREPHVNVVHAKVIEDYEHLDVIWAINMIDTVGREVKETIWRTASEAARAKCRTPVGCDDIEMWTPDSNETGETVTR